MKSSRRRYSTSDNSMEDRRARKHSKHGPRGRGNHPAGESNMAPHISNHRDSRRKISHRYDGDFESDADEGLTRSESARGPTKVSSQGASQHDEGKASLYRHLKEVQRVQRKVAPSDLSSEQEIHIHYVPIISSSPTNPFTSHHRSQSPSDKHQTCKSNSQVTPATDKHSTMSRASRRERSRSHDRSRKCSPRRSKHGHEKRGKHGKKADPYLEPLKQRWICYECGKIRSDKIRERHPLAVDQKMQPNWCGRCRISHELKGKPLAWYGQRHYCWGCGIVRSEKYHRENQLAPSQSSGPNYCRPCREASPGYEHNLREASEIGGEATAVDKAFMRQVHDANLSAIEEDKDDHTSTSNRAPGKENDAREGLLRTRETTSSLLKNRSFKTKTCSSSSSSSSEGNMPIKKLKDMHLEADRTLNFGGEARDGGGRLSAGSSYKPPSVESVSGCGSLVGGNVKTYHVSPRDIEHLARADGNGDCEMKDIGTDMADKACQADIDTTMQTCLGGPDTAVSPMDVHHQTDSGSRPTTSGTDGSGMFCNFPSGTSKTSAASLRCGPRRNPAETSTGSPPERDDSIADMNIGDNLRHSYLGSIPSAQWPAHEDDHGLPSHGTFGEVHGVNGMAGGYAQGRTLSGFPMPPTPPFEARFQPSRDHSFYDYHCHNMSPGSPYGIETHYGASGFGPGGGAEALRPDFDRPRGSFDSAAHFSDAHCHRDFSGNSYYDPATEGNNEYNASYPNDGFSQHAASYQYGHQPQYDAQTQYGHQSQYGPSSQYEPQTQYGPNAQYDSQGQYGHQAQYNSSNFPRQATAFGDGGNYASEDFGYTGTDKGNKVWTANSSSKTWVPTHEEVLEYMQQKYMSGGPQYQGKSQTTPRAEPQWKIYEDEDDGAAMEQDRSGTDSYAWRDGKTSVHHVNSTTPGNTVTILSIREITSDEDLPTKFGRGEDDDYDDDDHDSDGRSSLTAIRAG